MIGEGNGPISVDLNKGRQPTVASNIDEREDISPATKQLARDLHVKAVESTPKFYTFTPHEQRMLIGAFLERDQRYKSLPQRDKRALMNSIQGRYPDDISPGDIVLTPIQVKQMFGIDYQPGREHQNHRTQYPTLAIIESKPDFQKMTPTDRRKVLNIWLNGYSGLKNLSKEEQAQLRDRVLTRHPDVRSAKTSPLQAQDHEPVRLANGTEIVRHGTTGRGKLTVENGTDRDGVIKVVSTRESHNAYAVVYVRARDQIVIDEIASGTYQLLFSFGVDWNEESKKFRQQRASSKFKDTFYFREVREDDALLEGSTIRYSTWTVTLHAVPAGNAKKSSISDEEFDRFE